MASDDVKEIVDFIDSYIPLLEAEQKDVLKAIYLERKNISKLAKQGYYARSTFYYKAERIINELADTFDRIKS